MAKKSAKPQPRHTDPEDADREPSEDILAFEDGEKTLGPGGAVGFSGTASKADACRAALAEGITTTEEAVIFARSEFGIEIKPTDFTLYKSKAKRSRNEAAPRGKPGRKPRPAEGHASAPARPRAASGESELLEAMEAIKPLVDSMGADRVKRIVDLLG